MKCKAITVVIIVLGVFIIRFCCLKDKIENYEIVYEEVEVINHKVYYYDSKNLVNVDITFYNKIDIEEVFSLLTNKSNSIKENYDTKLITSTKILNSYIESELLILDLSKDFLRYNPEDAFEIYSQLQYTFSNLGFTRLQINIEGVQLEKIGYIMISAGIELSNI